MKSEEYNKLQQQTGGKSKKKKETSDEKRFVGSASMNGHDPADDRIEAALAKAINSVVANSFPGSYVEDNRNTFDVIFPQGQKYKISIKKVRKGAGKTI